MKRIAIITFGALLLGTIFFLWPRKPITSEESVRGSIDRSPTKEGANHQSDDTSKQRDQRLPPDGEEVLHKLTLSTEFDATQHPVVRPDRSYSKYVTPSSIIEIRTPDGRLLYKAEADTPFVGIKTIEGGKRIAINRGDGRYRIVDTETLDAIDLPTLPPVDRPVGFSWEWLTRDTLIGIAGTGYAETAKSGARCCDEHVVAASLVYLYDIKKSTLEAVRLPSPIKGAVFDLGSVTQDGFIELVSASGHEDDGKSLGWFNIIPN